MHLNCNFIKIQSDESQQSPPFHYVHFLSFKIVSLFVHKLYYYIFIVHRICTLGRFNR